jgi:hypothetical protein
MNALSIYDDLLDLQVPQDIVCIMCDGRHGDNTLCQVPTYINDYSWSE